MTNKENSDNKSKIIPTGSGLNIPYLLRNYLLPTEQFMNCIKMCGPNRFLRSSSICRLSSESNNNKNDPAKCSYDPIREDSLPEEPTTCCMSGCANCVWIEYAHQLSKKLNHGGTDFKELVLSKVSDPNMRAFLLMELKAIESNTNNK